ncbi:MAG: chromosome segregation protein [Thermosediminibacterales bacterium]|nr:chromosome segregation protein [Thermosediminibacterales bacterium]MDK2835461.1 chromosome segregation protein [Thermosediminibacterales bacterium]
MFLKRLDLYGFKSFANKLTLEFFPGITAIVGPNGSGKSNIADAIKWVLGEQSVKSLRGLKLEDVIFAGSKKLKPLGFAEVSLTIDNSDNCLPLDYNEITITRRVFRSGESEFYINKTSCRLKDIIQLFLGTGVGSEGYSIIGQGKIDEILSARPEDRRALFEEVAGIVKYKNRKREAEKKILETEQNIVRIDDILQEISSQMEPLKQQAEKAKRYNLLNRQLEELEVSLLADKIQKYKDKLQILDEERTIFEQELRKIQKLHDEFEQDLSKKTLELNEIEDKIYILQNDFHDKTLQIDKLETIISQGIDKINELKESNQKACLDMDEIGKRIESLKQSFNRETLRYEHLLTKINKKEILLKKKNEQLDEINQKLENEESILDKTKTEIIELLNNTAQKRNDLTGLQMTLQALKKRKEQLFNELNRLTKFKEKTIEELDNNNLSNIMKNIHSLQEELSIYNDKKDKLNNILNKYEKVKNETLSKKNKAGSRLVLLEEMEKGYEGFNKNIKEVLKVIENNDSFKKGFCGVIAQLIKVEQKYETAIEVALGSALQYLVTEEETTAKKIIDFIKRNNIGRATFLPLTTVKPRYLSGIKGKGFIGIASNLVSFDKKYNNVIKNLLGRVIVVQDLDSGIEIAKKYDFNYKIVTLEGDVINPGGSLTGGARSKNAFILGRAREINKLREIIEKLELRIFKLDNKVFELKKEMTETEKLIEQKNSEIHKKELELSKIQKSSEHLLIRKKEIEDQEKNIKIELKQIENEESEIQTQINLLNKQIQKINFENQKVENKIKDYQDMFKVEKQKKEELLKEIMEIKIDLASKSQAEYRIKENIKRIEVQLEELNSKRIALKTEIREKENKLEQLEKMIKDNENKKNNLILLKEELFHKLDKSKKNRESLRKQIHDIREKIKESNQNLSKFQERLHKIEVRQTRYQMEIQSLETMLWESYRLSFHDAVQRKGKIESYNLVEKKIAELKQEIYDMGFVNSGAINEYQRIQERYEFLTTQRDDLKNAKEALYKVIKEIVKTMQEQFVKSFSVLNKSFNLVFEELFGGGKAEIVLEDPEKPLETGIGIIAQPPGKKLQSLSLLSGGEKALTAIALLFAILRVKPTPFCVLDEIDASLDDANVSRFASFLKNYSKDTQFIVITHRKATMEVAETLYGITMEDTATSKMISVKLEEAS